jgi:hypothetical protein
MNLVNNSTTNYEFQISNYSVPFDFDDKKYLWLDYLEESLRQISIFHFDSRKTYTHKLSKEFGHISHMKLLPKNRLLLVRNHFLCEIREIDENFKLIHSFNNIGQSEIIAVDFSVDSILNTNYEKNYEMSVKNDIALSSINEESITVSILDINGNVNVWNNLEITNKFNLNEMNDISSEYKKKRFFSMNYPYYIKAYKNYFAVSTDFGVFVIKKK